MFTDKLFDHKYDIDDILICLCSDDTKGRFILNSRNGEVTHEEEASNIQDGDDNNHLHVLEPLPLSFKSEITSGDKFRRLSDTEKQNVQNILEEAPSLKHLLIEFEESLAGSFIRDQIKEAALEWLDVRGMIPPSMRHVKDISMLSGVPQSMESVKIQFD